MALATVTTDLDIAELACELLGEDPPLDITTPGSSTTEEIINRHYVSTRNALLRSHRWNFAVERVELVEDATAPNFGWSSRFAIPSDQLRILSINGIEAGLSSQPWVLEGDYVLINTNVAKCVYIKEVTDVELFDTLFVQAFAMRLAITCCIGITQSFEKKRLLEDEYEAFVLPEAIGVDAREDRPKIIPRGYESKTLDARKVGVYSDDLLPAVASEQWLELTGTILDGTNSIVVPYVDAAGGAVVMPIAPTLDEIILTPEFTAGGAVTSVFWNTGDATTTQITIRSGATNHGGIDVGLRIKRNT